MTLDEFNDFIVNIYNTNYENIIIRELIGDLIDYLEQIFPEPEEIAYYSAIESYLHNEILLNEFIQYGMQNNPMADNYIPFEEFRAINSNLHNNLNWDVEYFPELYNSSSKKIIIPQFIPNYEPIIIPGQDIHHKEICNFYNPNYVLGRIQEVLTDMINNLELA
jgi:hypothetical protein